MVRATLKESAVGLVWALAILLTLLVYYALSIEVPEFRYLGF